MPGFCSRASINQALYDAFQLWQWFYPYDNPVTGNYFRQDWSVLLAEEPYASAVRRSSGGSSSPPRRPRASRPTSQPDCLQAFQQGRVAMWHDDSGSIPEILDPEKSLVAEETAFWSLPCPEVNPANCALVQPFGTWINTASENKEAAWLLVQYLTSKETQAAAAQAGALLTPSRLSVLSGPGDGRDAPGDVPGGTDPHPPEPQRDPAAVHPGGRRRSSRRSSRASRSSSPPIVRWPRSWPRWATGIAAIMSVRRRLPDKPFPEFTK